MAQPAHEPGPMSNLEKRGSNLADAMNSVVTAEQHKTGYSIVKQPCWPEATADGAAICHVEVADGGLNQAGVLAQERKALIKALPGLRHGADVISLLSVPPWIMEPLTMLQKMAEIMEYTHLLEAANATADPWERFALVVAFLVSPFGACERTWKPFNPILGETFELALPKGARYLAEQISHHPPIGAGHAEGMGWTYDLVSAPTTRFLGNTLEVHPNGRTRIFLASSGETFTHVPPIAKVHNLVIGRTWIDAVGEFYVHNADSRAECRLTFAPCGWFGRGHHEFAGFIRDAEGCKRVYISGHWNSYCDAQVCGSNGKPLPGVPQRRLWVCTAKPDDVYGMTSFARSLNSTSNLCASPLLSDSRRRPDRWALEQGHLGAAGREKQRLEEKQRMDARHAKASGQAWKPLWFRVVQEGSGQLLPGELSAKQVPLVVFRGAWPNGWTGCNDQRSAVEPASICGVGFSTPTACGPDACMATSPPS